MLAADGARGLGPIYGGRIVAGLGIGAASNLTPLYISEIAPPAIRGQLIGMYEIGWQSALLSRLLRYGESAADAAPHVLQSVASSGSGSTTVLRSTSRLRASSGSFPSQSSKSSSVSLYRDLQDPN